MRECRTLKQKKIKKIIKEIKRLKKKILHKYFFIKNIKSFGLVGNNIMCECRILQQNKIKIKEVKKKSIK